MKNPASGMQIKTLRQGFSFGWFKDESEYCVYFKDSDDEISFKEISANGEFEYMNLTRYNSSVFINCIIKDFFNSTYIKTVKDDVVGFENKFFINMIIVPTKSYLDRFVTYFPDYKFDIKKITEKNYQITITTNKTINDLLSFVNIVAMFMTIIGDELIFIEEGLIDKYIRALNSIDSPYFIKNIFKVKFLQAEKLFNKYKNKLAENRQGKKIEFQYLDAHYARRKEISKYINLQHDVIDLGCGEGYYSMFFAKKLKDGKCIYAIDIDEEQRKFVAVKAKNKELDNIIIFESIDNFVSSENFFKEKKYDVILTEVIEHMSIEDARTLINKILDTININSFIITTPNATFNKNYVDLFGNENGMRHPDHKFEMTTEEFNKFMDDIFDKKQHAYSYRFVKIGDCVDDESLTNSVVITKQ